MNLLESSLDRVCDKETFVAFLGALIADHKNKDIHWENGTLDLFLEGMQGWLQDMDLEDFYRRMERQEVLSSSVNWRVFADILVAATVYE